MAEYIEREAALKIVTDMMCDCKVTHKGRAIRRNIKQIPTVDVVEVVRCKDCKYGDFYCSSILCGNAHAPWYNDEFDATMELDDYCSYGVRKEGAEE